MKRIGYFLLALVPSIIVELVQILSILYLSGVSMLFKAGSMSELISDANFNTMVMVIYTLIIICTFGIWYYCFLGGEYVKDVYKYYHPLIVVGVLILVPGAQFVSNYICNIIYIVKPDWWHSYEQLIESSGLSETNFLIVTYSIFLAPICEELIFRGVTMRSFCRAVPFWLANICQAILFGVFHMNIVQGIYAFVLGLLLGYLCEKGGSIYYSIFFHMLFNFWGTIITILINKISSTVVAELLIFFTTIISITAGFILFINGIHIRDRVADEANPINENLNQI